jgi:hypothetical protein
METMNKQPIILYGKLPLNRLGSLSSVYGSLFAAGKVDSHGKFTDQHG